MNNSKTDRPIRSSKIEGLADLVLDHYGSDPVPNQWMLNRHNPSLNTLNSAPNLPNHTSATQNGSSFSNTLGPLPNGPSSEQFNETDAESSPSQNDYGESSKSLGTPRSRRLKGRPRVGTLNNQSVRKSTALGSNNKSKPMKWEKGMKEKQIPDNASEQEIEELRLHNKQVGQARKEHTRNQNRISAQRSRQKKQENLENALARVQVLENQVANLRDDNQRLQNENQRLREQVVVQEHHIRNQMYRRQGMQPQTFNPYAPLPRLNVPSPMPPPGSAQYPTPMPGPASSPAAASTPTSSSAQYGGYMQQQRPQSNLPTPNPNMYQNMMAPQSSLQNSMQPHNSMQPQNPVQPPQGTVQAQSTTTQMSFGYGLGASNGNSQAPSHEQQGNTPGNASGNLQGGLQGDSQGNPPGSFQGNPQSDLQGGNAQGNFSNNLSEETPEHAHGDFLGDPMEQDQDQDQQDQDQSGGGMFELGPIDPELEFNTFGSPSIHRSPTQNPSNAG